MLTVTIGYCKLPQDRESVWVYVCIPRAQRRAWHLAELANICWVRMTLLRRVCQGTFGRYLISQELGWGRTFEDGPDKTIRLVEPWIYTLGWFLRHQNLWVYPVSKDHDRMGVGTLQDSLWPNVHFLLLGSSAPSGLSWDARNSTGQLLMSKKRESGFGQASSMSETHLSVKQPSSRPSNGAQQSCQNSWVAMS